MINPKGLLTCSSPISRSTSTRHSSASLTLSTKRQSLETHLSTRSMKTILISIKTKFSRKILTRKKRHVRLQTPTTAFFLVSSSYVISMNENLSKSRLAGMRRMVQPSSPNKWKRTHCGSDSCAAFTATSRRRLLVKKATRRWKISMFLNKDGSALKLFRYPQTLQMTNAIRWPCSSWRTLMEYSVNKSSNLSAKLSSAPTTPAVTSSNASAKFSKIATRQLESRSSERS